MNKKGAVTALWCLLAVSLFGCRAGESSETPPAGETPPAIEAADTEAEAPAGDPAVEREAPPPAAAREEAAADAAAPLRATLHTSLGEIVCVLYPEHAPQTVENFVALARGTRAWTDPASGEQVERPLYDGTIFHRVIPRFMVQGGDPQGDGRGGPGYRFEDEIVAELRFDTPGLLAMANAGPNTNGSQFFITLEPTPWLDGRHTIFGRVESGQEVAEAISRVERDRMDRPREPVVLERVVISGGDA